MKIEDIREQIDSTDDQLLKLFLHRMELSEQVVNYKKEHDLPITDRIRERQLLAAIKEKAGEKEEYAYQLFAKIIDLSKALQRELISGKSSIMAQINDSLLPAEVVFPKTGSVACQGTEGANSQAACDKLLPKGDIMYVKTFEAVFDAVESGFCRYGVVPIENNTYGSVRSVYELLQKKNFSIVRSVSLNIRHELLAKKDAEMSDITEIYSHEQAIGQCSRYLAKLGNRIKIVPCTNTALAAKAVAECEDNHMAAIASHDCVDLYDLRSLADSIQDNDNNYTKFILITKKPAIYAGANRISLVLACPNKPGALSDILAMFASHGINMVKLESCPVSGRNFEFVFYIELDASVRDEGVIPMLEELERTCESFSFLGNYQTI